MIQILVKFAFKIAMWILFILVISFLLSIPGDNIRKYITTPWFSWVSEVVPAALLFFLVVKEWPLVELVT